MKMYVRQLAVVFACILLPIPTRADKPPSLKAAVEKGLARVAQGAASYPKNRSCFSCHHQAMPIQALTAARQRGFNVPADDIKKHVEFSLKSFAKKDQIEKGQGIGGANTTVGYAFLTLAAVEHPADDTTQALIQFLLVRQRKDGAWPAVTKRPPSEGSVFTPTALALLALQKYGREKTVSDDLRARVDEAFAKGKDWLVKNSPADHEDRVFHLRGLMYTGAEAKIVAAARKAVLDTQRPDGSWSQLPDKEGDAYATGSALVALRIACLPASESAYVKGTKFLLSTQKEDGAWIVQTRSRPIQTFFDNGDPGGKSQFISMAATSWAVLALLENFPVALKKGNRSPP